ncbi:CBO0543 family protein [Alkalihalobacillus sp. BA299]|uniref:CBO0543 family protein n=1 Tax=Alkalihalobacillus sp. BA299 TaxID=2815938 RepID=UPI0035ABDEB7
MKQKQLLLLLPILLLTIIGRTWRDIPKYYKSLGYVSFFNSFYYYICKRYLLWEFPPYGFHWRLLRALHIFLITPLLVLAYLSSFPRSFSKKIVHLIKWTFISSLFEYFAVKQKMIKFKHGWNIYYSGLIYLKMYMLSYLHTKKPLPSWVLSIIFLIVCILKFKVPLKTRLLKGPIFFLIKKDKFSPFE